LCPLTGGDSPNGVQLPPQLRQAAGTLAASCGQYTANKENNGEAESRKWRQNLN